MYYNEDNGSSDRSVAHVDLPEFLEELSPQMPTGADSANGRTSAAVESRLLVDVHQRLAQNPALRDEAAVAYSLIVHPWLEGVRGIARWSGLHKPEVQEMVGQDGCTSRGGLLYTVTRGTASTDPNEREAMHLRYSESRESRSASCGTQTPSTSLNYYSFLKQDQDALVALGAFGTSKEVNGRLSAATSSALLRGAEHLAKLTQDTSWQGQALKALDPSLDLWIDGARDFSLGRQAWRLAYLFGGLDATVTSADVEALTGLTARGVRALLAKWGKTAPLAVEKVRVPGTRGFVYELRFGQLLDRQGDLFGLDTRILDATVRNTRTTQDMGERANAARRGTPEGAIAWKACAPRTRDRFLADLPEDADPIWRELVEQGDEMACYAYLAEQAKQAGAVPTSPKALEAPLPAPRVEVAPMVQQIPQRPQETPWSPEEPSQERLAQMRARLMARSLA